MGKHHKKDKKAKAPDNEISTQGATYSDGQRQDRVHYLEAKLILKPEPFTSVERFRYFGKLVKRTAKALGVGYISDLLLDDRPSVREIVFGDTADMRLYNNAFILRRRIRYVDGFPVGDPEIAFKFRYPDRPRAAAIDVRPNIDGAYRIKFKAEILPLKDQIGGFRTLYSHTCVFGLSQVHSPDKTSMATLSRVFPALAALRKSDAETISLVNQAIVEEVLLELGRLDFGKGVVAKSNVALWRTRGEHRPLVGEFAYQVRFDQPEDVSNKTKKRCEQFFITLQHDVQDWISLGTTKTGTVYRLNGHAPESAE